MNNRETLFIPLEEYTDFENSRLAEANLAINGIYTAMVRLGPNKGNLEAVKFPLRLCQLKFLDESFYSGTVTPLDNDLQDTFRSLAIFSNGYWTNIETEVCFIYPDKSKIRSKSSYLKPYAGPEDEALRKLNHQLAIPTQQLLSV